MKNISNEMAERIAKAINEGRIMAAITKVASSGMSRKIRFYEVENNRPYCITYYFCEIYGSKMTDNDEINIRGCGMDMIFHTIDTVANRLTDAGFPCKYSGYYQL